MTKLLTLEVWHNAAATHGCACPVCQTPGATCATMDAWRQIEPLAGVGFWIRRTPEDRLRHAAIVAQVEPALYYHFGQTFPLPSIADYITAEFMVGDQIAYLPTHVEGEIEHSDVEFGFITTINERHRRAWCRFFFHGTTELRTVSNSEVVGLESLLKYHHSEHRVIRAAQEKVWHDQAA